jgi:predicted esterase
MIRRLTSSVVLAFGIAIAGHAASAKDDVADVPSEDRSIGGDQQRRYFLIGAGSDRTKPEGGWGLVVVLPGGDGSAEFHPFVKRIWQNALPDGYLVAQPVAVQWTENQQVVWPTAKSRVPKMQFTTEQFVDSVIDDVSGDHPLDTKRIFTLSWSSSGPAAYAIALTSKKVTGSFIAMSVFKPGQLPPLKASKDKLFYVYHSREDQVCPYRMAEQAKRDLEKQGARIKLVDYEGAHGWTGPAFVDIRAGIDWLAAESK